MSEADARFDRIYRRYQPRVLSYCLRRTTMPDASDATAEVFAIAWRRRADMPTGDGALPWLYGVAKRVLGHQWRGVRRRLDLTRKVGESVTPSSLSPEDVIVEREDYVHVRQALNGLKSIDREVLMLSAWEGLSHAEIAETLGVSLVAVDKRLVRAKQRLARQFHLVTDRRYSSVKARQRWGGR